MNFYEECFVWVRHNNNCGVRYTCLKNLQTDMYCVQSADFYLCTRQKRNELIL